MYKAQRTTDEKIVDTDDESFIQPSNLRELLTHRDDVIYAARQNQTKTFNMRTWALSSRGVRSSATASVGGGQNDGMSQVSGVSPTTVTNVNNNAAPSPSSSKAPPATKKRAKQQQWLVDDEGAVEVDKPFFDYTFEHSSILEHRVDCPVRPTSNYALASIHSWKPGMERNLNGSSFLEEQAETRVDESMRRRESLFPNFQQQPQEGVLSLTVASVTGTLAEWTDSRVEGNKEEEGVAQLEGVSIKNNNALSILTDGSVIIAPPPSKDDAPASIPSSRILGKGPLLDSSFIHPLQRATSNLPPAFGAAYQDHLASTASRVDRHREKLQFELEQSIYQQQQQQQRSNQQQSGDEFVTTYSSSRFQNIPLHYQQSASSRPESPILGIKPPRSPNDFLYMAPTPTGTSTPPTTSLQNSRPTSQMTAGGRAAQPLPLPEFYRLSSPEAHARHSSNVTIEPTSVEQKGLEALAQPSPVPRDGSPYRINVGNGKSVVALLSTSATTSASAASHKNDTSLLSNFTERTQRILQSKAGSRLRRYYGENMHIMRRMDRALSASQMMMTQQENQLLLLQGYDEGAESNFQNAHFGASHQNLLLSAAAAATSHRTAPQQSYRGKSNSLADVMSVSAATGALSGSYEELSPPAAVVARRGGQASGMMGGGDYDWRCYQSTTKFMKPDVQRRALASPCDTQVPLYHPVAYSELFEEQRILAEQRDLHNTAYEATKAIYRQQGAYIQVAMEAMSKGEFQKSYAVESSALTDIPELELTRMRLQRDTVPVMTVCHEGISTVTPAGGVGAKS